MSRKILGIITALVALLPFTACSQTPTENYKECTDVAKEEADSNARPAIKGDVAVEDYDVIYIGY